TLIAIPLTLSAIHFSTIGLDTTGVNPARSFAPVLLSGKHWADIWLFILGPAIGAIVGCVAHMVTVRGDTTLTGDLVRAATDMRGVDMDEIRQGLGQVPPRPARRTPSRPSSRERRGPSPANVSVPSPSRAKASARRTTFLRSVSEPRHRKRGAPSGAGAGRNRSRSTPESSTVVLPRASG